MTDDRPRRYARRLACFGAVTLAVHLGLAAVVYRDAADREVSGCRWAALTALGGLFGLGGYLRRR